MTLSYRRSYCLSLFGQIIGNPEGNEQAPEAPPAAEGDDDDEEEDDGDDMVNRAPPPPAPARPAAAAHPGDVDQLARALGRVSLPGRQAFAPYNFNFRFPIIFTVSGTLADGHTIVYADYLCPTLHATRFNYSVSKDGLTATLSMQLP